VFLILKNSDTRSRPAGKLALPKRANTLDLSVAEVVLFIEEHLDGHDMIESLSSTR